jgi:hypothetical protein
VVVTLYPPRVPLSGGVSAVITSPTLATAGHTAPPEVLVTLTWKVVPDDCRCSTPVAFEYVVVPLPVAVNVQLPNMVLTVVVVLMFEIWPVVTGRAKLSPLIPHAVLVLPVMLTEVAPLAVQLLKLMEVMVPRGLESPLPFWRVPEALDAGVRPEDEHVVVLPLFVSVKTTVPVPVLAVKDPPAFTVQVVAAWDAVAGRTIAVAAATPVNRMVARRFFIAVPSTKIDH